MTSSVDAIESLFAEHGEADYVGEPVSQMQHSLQCAAHARAAGANEAAIAGALLHDIGHMLGLRYPEKFERMGFPFETTEIVRRHVDAKRYLCWKNPVYKAKLSEASLTTLGYQGGPMGEEEAKLFEADPLSPVILKMRTWDEAAKDPAAKVPGVDSYRSLLLGLLVV